MSEFLLVTKKSDVTEMLANEKLLDLCLRVCDDQQEKYRTTESTVKKAIDY